MIYYCLRSDRLLRSLGERIRRTRRRKGWTQAQLAEALGIRAGTLSGYEREYRRPDVEMLDRIASVLGVSVDYLLGRVDDVSSHTDSRGDAHSEERDPLVDLALEAIPELSPEGRSAVERFIEYCRETDRRKRDRTGRS